jgi:plasmid stabilization system protein ParE
MICTFWFQDTFSVEGRVPLRRARRVSPLLFTSGNQDPTCDAEDRADAAGNTGDSVRKNLSEHDDAGRDRHDTVDERGKARGRQHGVALECDLPRAEPEHAAHEAKRNQDEANALERSLHRDVARRVENPCCDPQHDP